MVRTQIQLTPEQARKLKRVAQRKGVSMAEIIRRSVDTALACEDIPDQGEIRARARSVFGKYQDSAADVSENHDRYLSEAFSS
ncbi:MAG: ribbon-helix-helix domain-containing protein [Armatimonadota bacterium]